MNWAYHPDDMNVSTTDQNNTIPPSADSSDSTCLPENQTKNTLQKSKNIQAPKTISSGWSLAFFSFLIASAAVGLSGYLIWRVIPIEQNQPLFQEAMNQLQAQVARQQARLTTVDETTTPALETLQNLVFGLEKREERLLSRIDWLSTKVTNLEGSSRSQWYIGEVEFLLRLANQRLLTSHDTASALSLMESADQILDQMNEFSVFPLREALTEDIAVLKTIDTIDQESIWLRLHALTGLIPQLITLDDNQLTENTASVVEEIPVSASPEQGTTWQRTVLALLTDTWQHFTSLFRINTDRGEPIEILLSAEQNQLMRQKLILFVEQSKLALLTKEPLIYLNNLQEIIDWINQYYALGGEKTSQVLAELNELKSLSITPEIPDIHRSLEALQEYQSTGLITAPDS
ncbi:MAG: uroporphyrinogen-III C-methyltransferase, partial [Endozoicomonas sp.]